MLLFLKALRLREGSQFRAHIMCLGQSIKGIFSSLSGVVRTSRGWPADTEASAQHHSSLLPGCWEKGSWDLEFQEQPRRSKEAKI